MRHSITLLRACLIYLHLSNCIVAKALSKLHQHVYQHNTIYVATIDPFKAWRVGNVSVTVSGQIVDSPITVRTPLRGKYATIDLPQQFSGDSILSIGVSAPGYMDMHHIFSFFPQSHTPMVLHLPITQETFKFGTYFILTYNPQIVSDPLQLGFVDTDCSCFSTFQVTEPCLNKGSQGAFYMREDGLQYLLFKGDFLPKTSYKIFVFSPQDSELADSEAVITQITDGSISKYAMEFIYDSNIRLWVMGTFSPGVSKAYALDSVYDHGKPLLGCELDLDTQL